METKNKDFQPPLRQTDVSRRRLRYRLHYLIRKEGFDLITKNRTIYCDHDKPVPESRYLSRLIKEFGYCIQFRIYGG